MAVVKKLKPGERLAIGDDITVECQKPREGGQSVLVVKVKEQPRYHVRLIADEEHIQE